MRFVVRLASLVLPLTLMAGASALAEEHTHQFADWTHVEGTAQHTAVCADCSEVVTTSCVNYTVSGGYIGRSSACFICGNASEVAFEHLEATATPLADKPGTQRGVLSVVGQAQPFPEAAPDILYAFALGYNNEGKAATFKNKSTVEIQLNAELPEGFVLQRVTPSSGDDSTQTPERRTDIACTYENGTLSFESKHAALYIIVAGEE